MNVKSKLKIAFDVTWIDGEGTIGGGFQYAERLINTLVVFTGCRVIIFVMEKGRDVFKHLESCDNCRVITIPDEVSMFKMIRKEKIDVMHAPVQLNTIFLKSIPIVTTLHDLQHYHFPEFFSDEVIAWREKTYKQVVRESRRIIVSYNHVKEDIVNYYKARPEIIDVCPVGIDVPLALDNIMINSIVSRYQLPNNYLIYCANLWLHKNHISLINALKVIHDKYKIKISLVFTGKTDGDYKSQFEFFKNEVNKLSLEDYVIFTGYIPEEDKLLILKNARLAVVPTLYEAGSFPLIEAMNYGIPVICSNVTSLPDQIGDKRFIFNPKDVNEIAKLAADILSDDKLILENKQNSARMVNGLRWENIIINFIESYERAALDYSKKSIVTKFCFQLEDIIFYLVVFPFRKFIKSFKPAYTPVLRTIGFYRLMALIKK